jgi:phage repressor protein C with HTH and peptisase S24 domain
MGKKYLEIGKRLRLLRGKKTQIQFAADIGTTLRAYQHYEYGEREPDSNILKEVSAKYGKSIDWILKGENEEKNNQYPIGDQEKDEFVNIPRFSDRISAGGGLVPINNIDIKVAFRRDWIFKKGDPTQMSLISVSGDSMYPTLMAGDLVLINHGYNYLDPQGGLYAIALGDLILIKRLQILYPSGKVRIISDNEKYDSFDLSQEEVKINGRVIWFGREL